jgi:N-acyl-D-amino-acid deacylase
VDRLDVVIRNGSVVDGTGAAPYPADVGIRDDRVTAVGRGLKGAMEVDATGCLVTPGFIDVHSHDDFAVLMEPALSFKVRQGVTTVVVGNCGTGIMPFEVGLERFRRYYPAASPKAWRTFGQYMNVVQEAGPAVNVAVLAGHGSLRRGVMGLERRGPDAAEMSTLADQVEDALEDGCLGLSSGLAYLPGAFATAEEIADLCERVADANGIYTCHIRNEAAALQSAVAEFIAMVQRTGVSGEISHLKSSGQTSSTGILAALAQIDHARAMGLDVNADMYPYAASSTELSALQVNKTLSPDSDGAFGHVAAEQIVIASCPGYPEYVGRTLADLGEAWQKLQDEVVDRLLSEAGESCFVVLHAMNDDDVMTTLMHPAVMVGSDGLPTLDGAPHPRLYGTFPRVLHRCIGPGLLDWESAIHKMTALPAVKFGLVDRGEIRPGAFADLVVIRPNTILDMATYESPRTFPAGIDWVLVNGRVVVKRGEQADGARPGRILRRLTDAGAHAGAAPSV